MCGKEVHAHALRTGVGFDGFIPNAVFGHVCKMWKNGISMEPI
jgi:hypothetical protein